MASCPKYFVVLIDSPTYVVFCASNSRSAFLGVVPASLTALYNTHSDLSRSRLLSQSSRFNFSVTTSVPTVTPFHLVSPLPPSSLSSLLALCTASQPEPASHSLLGHFSASIQISKTERCILLLAYISKLLPFHFPLFT